MVGQLSRWSIEMSLSEISELDITICSLEEIPITFDGIDRF
jgi:hypothetical protein